MYSIFSLFGGAEGEENISQNWMKSTKRKVVQETGCINLDESDDDEIEMVAVVTSDNRKFKTIKVEDEEDVKIRKIF